MVVCFPLQKIEHGLATVGCMLAVSVMGGSGTRSREVGSSTGLPKTIAADNFKFSGMQRGRPIPFWLGGLAQR